MSGKLASTGFCAVASTPAIVSLITFLFCGGWRAWARVAVEGGGGGLGTLTHCAIPTWHAYVGCL